MRFKLLDSTNKEVGTFELSQEQIQDDFVYEMEKAISKALQLPWTEVFLDGMDENLTGMDMFTHQSIFNIITMISTTHKINYTVMKIK